MALHLGCAVTTHRSARAIGDHTALGARSPGQLGRDALCAGGGGAGYPRDLVIVEAGIGTATVTAKLPCGPDVTDGARAHSCT